MKNNPAYELARERYAEHGIDTEAVIQQTLAVPMSLHCWQGDDVRGFEQATDSATGGGILATGSYLGRARNQQELCTDIDLALSLIPGAHKLNLHAIYADYSSGFVERDALTIQHFKSWVEWARLRNLGLDFNPTCFGHPLAADGFTLSNQDPAIRRFWINHCIASRKIGAEMGHALGKPVVTNLWIPDGYKDTPVDRLKPRERLRESLDEIYHSALENAYHVDAVESKLFGLGIESYTVGSHEFYLGYATQKKIALCLDAGHFHPTESIADKISSTLLFVPQLLLHVSRGVRWDSDHVVTLDDPTKGILEEVVACQALDRVHIGLDFFDASINRIAAWVIGMRNTRKALLIGLLKPWAVLRELENQGDFTARLVLLEETKSLPWSAVWDEICLRQEKPADGQWLSKVRAFERS